MNTPSFQPDPTGDPRKTSDYRAHQLQDAAARTTRVERARLEKLWNQHLDGEMAADSKAEFEVLCKRYPDLSRELRSTGMLLSGMNLLTADVPAAPVTDRERTAAILAAVQAERPFVSASEARAIRRQRWILVGSAAALLISVIAADRLFPGWKDPAGMVASRGVSAPAIGANRDTQGATSQSAADAAKGSSALAASSSRSAAQSRRESLNANAKLSLGTPAHGLNFSTDLAPTMASQAGLTSRTTAQSFDLHAQEAWLLRSVAAPEQPIGPLVASARLRLTDPVLTTQFSARAQALDVFDGAVGSSFDDRWNGLLKDRPLPVWYTTPHTPKSSSKAEPGAGSR